MTDFIFLGSKITADGDCSHEIKRRLLLGRKVMTNLNSMLKSRDITLSTKIRLVNAVVFPVVRYECESWTVKKAECQRIDAFELWCWRRLLRVPWTAISSNQSILKEISPEYSLQGQMLKLSLQYFGHLMQRTDSLEKTLILGKIEGRRRGRQRMRYGWMVSLTRWTWVWTSSGSWWWTGKPGMLQSVHGVTKNWTRLRTDLTDGVCSLFTKVNYKLMIGPGQSKDLTFALYFNKVWSNKLLSTSNKGGNYNRFINKVYSSTVLQNIEICEYLWLLMSHIWQFAEADEKWKKNRKVHRDKWIWSNNLF